MRERERERERVSESERGKLRPSQKALLCPIHERLSSCSAKVEGARPSVVALLLPGAHASATRGS